MRKERKHMKGKQESIIKLDFLGEQTVGEITKIVSICNYTPQKIGKNPQSYVQALSGFKMALAGIL